MQHFVEKKQQIFFCGKNNTVFYLTDFIGGYSYSILSKLKQLQHGIM
ncbi:hypothetical protein QUF74_00580 [Candidatus Halobeggiatoa sp. HSG11]|nr:hypothetical protein [Candidatus Halobeggiatoa sp. HSG11]